MEGVCVMLDEKPDWPTAKKVLGDSQFLQNLKTYDKDNIPEPTIKKLQKSAAASRDASISRPRAWSRVLRRTGSDRAGPRRDAVVVATRESYAVAATL